MTDGDAAHHEPASQRQIEAAREEEQMQREAEESLPQGGRAEILSVLDESAFALDKTRAQLTDKWRRTHSIGAVANLEDAEKVSDVALWRFVLSVQPYVEQARKRKQQEQSEGSSDARE